MPADLGGDIYASLEDRKNLAPIEDPVRGFSPAFDEEFSHLRPMAQVFVEAPVTAQTRRHCFQCHPPARPDADRRHEPAPTGRNRPHSLRRRPARPGSGPPRRSAEALATATDRPTGAALVSMATARGRGADRRLDRGPGQAGRNRPSGHRPSQASPRLARTGHLTPADALRAPNRITFDPKNRQGRLRLKIALVRNQLGDLECVNYAVYRNIAVD